MRLFRVTNEAVPSRILTRLCREWRSEGELGVARLPLIHVVGAEEVSGLSGHGVQGGRIEIGEIGSESLRRTIVAAGSFDRVSAAGLRLFARAGPVANNGNSTQDRILDGDGILRTPVPGTQIGWRLPQRLPHPRGQQILQAGISLWQPTPPPGP